MTTYRISQLAELVGLPPTTLRFYEQAGLLPTERSQAGYRLYGQDALARLAFIRSGKQLGLPLEEIRDLLEVWNEGPCTEVRRRLRPMVLTRISEASQRAAELDAFTDRLRHALADLDDAPPAGNCAPGCGCLSRDEAAPVGDAVPVACTLTEDDRGERVGQWQQVGRQALRREHVDDGLRIALPIALAGTVAALAVAEQQCCPFFEFTLRLAGAEVELEVRAPGQAATLLAAVLADAD